MSVTSENSAYVIVVNDDNSMTTTSKRRIIQRSKMIDDLWFLVKPEYNGYNMAEFMVMLEYVSPVSHKYRTEFLTMSKDSYNGYLKYVLPFDTSLTKEAGKIDLLLTFARAELDEYGNSQQRVRKVSGTSIDIIPISAWSDIIPDCALSALDQRIIKLDAQIKAVNETTSMVSDSKADNITYDDKNNTIQLKSGDRLIGDKITINHSGIDKDGLPVVDFSGNIDAPDEEEDNSNDVVEF